MEISVEDNGRGLSAEDIAHIIGEKVYDSRAIGMKDAADPEELKENKGSGFGLMNCKGIIEKYKKTNELFRVCVFDIESEPGKGSRFYFRLPSGVRKVIGVLLCLLLPLGMASCLHEPFRRYCRIVTPLRLLQILLMKICLMQPLIMPMPLILPMWMRTTK